MMCTFCEAFSSLGLIVFLKFGPAQFYPIIAHFCGGPNYWIAESVSTLKIAQHVHNIYIGGIGLV